MKALFLTTSSSEVQKYEECLRNLGVETRSATYDTPGISEKLLFDRAKEYAPDMIVYIGSRWGATLSLVTLARLQSHVAPSVHICSDAADPPWHDLLREYAEKGAFTLQVAIDGSDRWPGSKRGLTLLTPVETANFQTVPALHQRPILAGFAGNAGGGGPSKRTLLLTELLAHKAIDLRTRSPLPYTYDGYCDYLTKLKVSLNIAYSGTEQTMHVKGRVIESGLAGCVLLENAASGTASWFDPGTDYMVYEDAEDARRKIKEISNMPQLALQEMAASLRRKVTRDHSPLKFWTAITDRLGVRLDRR